MPAALKGIILDVPEDADERRWRRDIEELRARLRRSTRRVKLLDGRARRIGRAAAIPPLWGRRLFRIVRALRPRIAIELGTSTGISAAYQAAALATNGGGQLVTLEAVDGVATVAERVFQILGLRNVSVVRGFFADTLPPLLEELVEVDYAYIDGHHDQAATLRYLDLIRPRLSARAVVVFDDVRWSGGMRVAWKQIRKRPDVTSALDLGRMGVCTFAPG